MPHLADEDIGIECQYCYREFSTFAGLEEHTYEEHTGPRQCSLCGKQLREHEYHKH